MDNKEKLIEMTQNVLCEGCDNYRMISFYNINKKACYCNINPLICVLAQKKFKKNI